MQVRLFTAANLMGLFFAYIDSRPNWDDTGVLVGLIILASAILGSLGPRRPWLWALAIGVWMPLQESVTTHRPPASAVAIIVALAGAYLGAGLRRLADPTT